MLDDKDIQKMQEVFPTKEDLKQAFSEHTFKEMEIFTTKDDLKGAVVNLVTKDDFNNLQTSVDAYTQKADTYFQEMTMLTHKVNRLEKWI
jgi:predicted  nucleic acid-binding Zn-ribbon protein